MGRVHFLSKVLVVPKSNPVTGARIMYHDQVGLNLGPCDGSALGNLLLKLTILEA